MYRWFFAVALFLVPTMAPAGTLVVAPSGSDSNPCTESAPCRTIHQGLSRCGSGDTLTIHGGTYEENNLQPPSGSTVEGASGETVTIRPTGDPAPGFALGAGVRGVTIRNLTIDGSGGGISYGMMISEQDNTIDTVEVANVQNQGIAVYCASGNHPGCGHGGNTLRHAHIHGSGSAGCHGTTAKDGFCHGVYVYSDDNVIDGNEFHHNNGWGIQTYGANLQVINVFVHDNVSGGITIPGSAHVSNSIFTGNNPDGQAAVIWAGSNSSFKDLTIEDNPSSGLFIPAGTSNVTVDNVLSAGNKPDLRNNTSLSVSTNGTGASLVPGSTTTPVPAPTPPAVPPSRPPAPRNLRVIGTQ